MPGKKIETTVMTTTKEIKFMIKKTMKGKQKVTETNSS